MRRIIFLCLMSFMTMKLTAQILLTDEDQNILELNLVTCEYEELLGFDHDTDRFTDIALSPEGKLFAVGNENDVSFIVEILSNGFLKMDTLLLWEEDLRLTSLVCDENNVLWFGGKNLYSYNLDTNDYNDYGLIYGSYSLSGDLVWYEGKLYGSIAIPFNPSFPSYFIEIDVSENLLVTILSEDFPRLIGLTKSCNVQDGIIELKGNSITGLVDTSFFYTVDVLNLDVINVCSISLGDNNYVFGLSSEDEFRTNCSLQLDLDADNSSGRFIDHFYTDSLCTRSYRLADQDVAIQAPDWGLDSMTIAVTQSDFGMQDIALNLHTAHPLFTIVGLGTATLRVVPTSSAVGMSDYADLIRSVRLELTAAALITAQTEVAFHLYSQGSISDAAIAFVDTRPDIMPYAGEDISIESCFFDGNWLWEGGINLHDALGDNVYESGQWEPALHTAPFFNSAFGDQAGEYLYIAQEGNCAADTARVEVSFYPYDLNQNYGGTATAYQELYLCEGDTVEWAFDTSAWSFWGWDEHNQITDTSRLIHEAGLYPLHFVTAEGNCHFKRTTRFRAANWEGDFEAHDTIRRCEGFAFDFYGQLVENDTTLCRFFDSTSDCDYTVCKTYRFDPAPIEEQELAICEEDAYEVQGELFTESGLYELLLSDGICDTFLYLDLSVHPHYEQNLVVGLPPGATYTVGDSVLSAAGMYDILLSSSQGCDSLLHVTIETVNHTTQANVLQKCTLPTIVYKGQKDILLDQNSSRCFGIG